MSLGLGDVFEGPTPVVETPRADPREVLLANQKQVVGLAEQIRAVLTREGLADYGAFRLAVLAVDQLPIEVGGSLHTVAGGLQAGAWSATSRVLAVCGVLRALGFGVVPHLMADGTVCAALPLGDDATAYNSNLVKASARVRRGGRAPETHRFQWLLWDGEGRLGGPKQGGTLVLPILELLQGPQRPFHLVERRIPAFTLRAPDPQVWPVYGRPDLMLTYHQHEHARGWLALYPALSFAHQVRHAIDELEAMDLAPSLQPLLERGLSDQELVDTLLCTVQAHIQYKEGPLRDLFDILHDRTGDCDQLSLLLAALLVACGWRLDDLRALRWPGHLALGVLSRDDSQPDGIFIDIAGQRFHALDGAYVHRTGEALTSRWGQLHDRYAHLRFAPQRIG